MITPRKINSLIEKNQITKNILYEYLKNKGYKGISKLNKIDLLTLYKLAIVNKKNVMAKAKAFNIKGRSKLNKLDLVTTVFKKNKQYLELIPKIEEDLRKSRDITKYRIIQPGPVKVKKMTPLLMEQLPKNKKAVAFSFLFSYFVDRAIKTVFNNKNIIGISVQALYIFMRNGNTPKYSQSVNFTINDLKGANYSDKLNFTLPKTDSNTPYYFIGYKINFLYGANEKMTKTQLKQLKAFHPTKNIKFHQLSVSSTSNSGLCIYETWRDIIGTKQLKYSFRNNKKYRSELLNALHNEGNDIENNIKAGNLVDSLCLLTKKYKNDILVVYFGSNIIRDNETSKIKFNGDQPIYINKGVVELANSKTILSFKNKK